MENNPHTTTLQKKLQGAALDLENQKRMIVKDCHLQIESRGRNKAFCQKMPSIY
jgi:hypothetical protein